MTYVSGDQEINKVDIELIGNKDQPGHIEHASFDESDFVGDGKYLDLLIKYT